MKMILALLTFMAPIFASADMYECPSPDLIRCVPAVSVFGAWMHNGGQTTGNSFVPNNQCANVIQLSRTQQRLLCCYEKCGVFIRDVKARKCAKLDESTFECK